MMETSAEACVCRRPTAFGGFRKNPIVDVHKHLRVHDRHDVIFNLSVNALIHILPGNVSLSI